MKTTEKMIEKRIYISPALQLIKLDNEISLALQSIPPEGPGEGASLAPEYFDNDTFKSNLV